MLEPFFFVGGGGGKRGFRVAFVPPVGSGLGRAIRKEDTNGDGRDDLQFRNFFVCVVR